MKATFTKIALAGAVVLTFTIAVSSPASAAFLLNFEGFADGDVATGLGAISFQSFNGYTSIIGNSATNLYNTYSDDLGMGWNGQFYHHNGYNWLWAGPNADAQGVIVDFFNNDGTFLRTGYSSASDFTMEAHLTDGSVVSTVGGANLNSPMGFLQVDANAGTFIDFVVLHDTGNAWLIDDMSGDASGIVPEPATLTLLGLGGLLAGALRRRRRS